MCKYFFCSLYVRVAFIPKFDCVTIDLIGLLPLPTEDVNQTGKMHQGKIVIQHDPTHVYLFVG